MDRRLFLSGLALSPFAPMLARAARSTGTTDVNTAANQLAFDLFGRAAQKDNPFISPLSISAALSMTLAGARTTTEAAMRKVMHLPGSHDAIGQDWHKTIQSLQRGAGKTTYQLNLANRLFGDRDTRFDAAFLGHNKRYFGAPVEQLAFRTSPEPSRERINAWVEEQTQQRIKKLLQPGMIHTMTRLVLVNAIWFKAGWTFPFPKHATRDGDFKLEKGGKVTASFMHVSDEMAAGTFPGGQILALPYGEGRTRMLVIMPTRADGMKALMSSLSSSSLRRWTTSLDDRIVNVALPRFKSGGALNLKHSLSALGMKEAFEPGADFSAMTGRRHLYLDEVVHKTFIEVMEKGTEAAAATAVLARDESAPAGRPMDFRCDRPFLYAIEDTRTRALLFLGKMDNPTLKSA